MTVDPKRLLVERAKFSPHVMVSAGVCYGGKGRLHFVDEKAKINAEYYMTNLLLRLIEDCQNLIPNYFIKARAAQLLILTLWTTMCGDQCYKNTKHIRPSQATRQN